MRRRVEVHQIKEREKYHKYWILHLPMILNTIKKGFSQKNINANNKYIQIGKTPTTRHMYDTILFYIDVISIQHTRRYNAKIFSHPICIWT